MYARYIPAKRSDSAAGVKSGASSAVKKPSANGTLAGATKRDASSTYSRYIPPPKAPSERDSQLSSFQLSEPSSVASPKRKRDVWEDQPGTTEKKRKKDKVKNEAMELSRHQHAESALVEVESMESVISPQEPELKHTRKKEKRRTVEDDQSKEDGSGIPVEDSKHKRLLEKRGKSIKKAEKLARREAKRALEDPSTGEEVLSPAEEEVHDLVPFPQPEPVPELPVQSLVSSLPSWLGSPIRVSTSANASFRELGIQEEVVKSLQAKGFNAAFAVQAAVLPLLLPSYTGERGDVLVSAATGSGKTLAYVLPMIDEISRNTVTRLRGLIVMPTRELVAQAREVCELCASSFSICNRKRVRIGTAVGSATFKEEQSSLMEQVLRYDPEGYKELHRRLNSKWESSDLESDGEYEFFCQEEAIPRLPDHVIDHASKVDILICTPGRLVEHLRSTPGFSLEFVKWMVIDEADKLLDQSYQQWLDVVMSRLDSSTDSALWSKRDRVKKVILSATMTTDVGQLNKLKLRRPKLIVLEGSPQADGETVHENDNVHAHVVPSLLVESAIKVDDESIKPLYLLELLARENLILKGSPDSESPVGDDTSDETSSNASSSDDENSSSDESISSSDGSNGFATHSHIDGQDDPPKPETPRGVLIFTKSNETALRLGRLLSILSPSISDVLTTLTSTTRSSARRAALHAFEQRKLSIIVASDLVSRGLDLPNLAHVINYDVPTSVTNYVHRVGRTARAGKSGKAWTLFTGSEARWFWNDIARNQLIERQGGKKIARVTINAENIGEDERRKYELALETLGKEASGIHDKKSSKGR